MSPKKKPRTGDGPEESQENEDEEVKGEEVKEEAKEAETTAGSDNAEANDVAMKSEEGENGDAQTKEDPSEAKPKDEEMKSEEVKEAKPEDEETKGEEVKEEAKDAETTAGSNNGETTDAVMKSEEAENGAGDAQSKDGSSEAKPAGAPVEEDNLKSEEYVMKHRITEKLENLQPSDWFKKKWEEWQKDLQGWHKKHVNAKGTSKEIDPSKMGALCKAGPAPKPEPVQEKTPETKEEEAKKIKEELEVDENKDPLQQIDEEMDREDLDIFGLEDVCNIGDGKPLFSNFAFEDWALLSLRFELHLLVHAFMQDAKDADQFGVYPEHIQFYYNKYYKKVLNPQKYGAESVNDLIGMIQDTVMIGLRSKNVQSHLPAEVECNELFIKLTEEARRDRQRRVDAGETSAALKFARPPQVKASFPDPPVAAESKSSGAAGALALAPAKAAVGVVPVQPRPKQWSPKAPGVTGPGEEWSPKAQWSPKAPGEEWSPKAQWSPKAPGDQWSPKAPGDQWSPKAPGGGFSVGVRPSGMNPPAMKPPGMMQSKASEPGSLRPTMFQSKAPEPGSMMPTAMMKGKAPSFETVAKRPSMTPPSMMPPLQAPAASKAAATGKWGGGGGGSWNDWNSKGSGKWSDSWRSSNNSWKSW